MYIEVTPWVKILLIFGVAGLLFFVFSFIELIRAYHYYCKKKHEKQEQQERQREITFFDIGIIVIIIAAAITYIFQPFKRKVIRPEVTEVRIREEEK